eukprot:scaffold23502_cov117-Skeletonema_marinoi.AAC.3
MASSTIVSFFLFIFFFGSVNSFFTPAASLSWGRLQSTSLAVSPQDDGNAKNVMLRREIMQKSLTFGALLTASPAYARSAKSRTTGYDVQHTEAEWAQMLSPQQSFILRQGGTESPYSSILEGEGKSLVASWMLLAWMVALMRVLPGRSKVARLSGWKAAQAGPNTPVDCRGPSSGAQQIGVVNPPQSTAGQGTPQTGGAKGVIY